MASSVIGALRVVLGADTAQFERGLKRSESRLDRFSRNARVAGEAIGAAITVATVGLGVAINKTLGEMDKFAKAAQKIGVPVEQLTALTHAAELSGASFSTLEKGLGRLSRNLVEAEQGLTTPIRAFETLGISIRNTEGQIKTTGDLLPELADKFAAMRDGPEKTALAMQLLGRAGTELIPLLNGGAASLRALSNESAALGLTFNTETAQAAERFNDAMSVLTKQWQGFMVQVTSALAGPMASLAESLRGSATEAGLLVQAGQKVGEWMVNLIPVAIVVAREIAVISAEIAQLAKVAKLISEGEFLAAFTAFNTGMIEVAREVRAGFGEFSETFARNMMAAELGINSIGEAATKQAPAIINYTETTKAAAAAQRELNQAIQGGVNLAMQALTPLEEYRLKIADLQAALNAGKINADQFGTAQTMAAASAVQPWLNVAGTVGNALGTLFEDNKGIAVAQAIINTAQGVTAALAQYPPPLSFAMAAAQAAAGAAQIATIKSARPGSSGSAPRPSAGGGSSSATQGPQAASGASANITLVGDTFSRDQIRDLFDKLNTGLRDGYRINLVTTQ